MLDTGEVVGSLDVNALPVPTSNFPLEENKFWRLIEIAKNLAGSLEVNALCQNMLEEAIDLTNADAGTLFLRRGIGKAAYLEFSIIENRSQSIKKKVCGLPPIPLFKASGEENVANVVAFSAHYKTVVNIQDAYNTERFDFSGTKKFDKLTGYRTLSVLTVPLIDHSDQLIGVVELLNAKDADTGELIPFSDEAQLILEALSSLVSVTLRNHILTRKYNEMLIRFAAEGQIDSLFEMVIREAQKITGAEGGTLYLLEGKNKEAILTFQTICNDGLKLSDQMKGKDGVEQNDRGRDIPLYLENGEPNTQHVASYVALNEELINIPDVYDNVQFDFTSTKAFDKAFNYQSRSFLTIPLLNHRKSVIGVLQLINARDQVTKELIPFNRSIEPIIEALANYIGFALNNQILVQQHRDLLDAFVVSIAKAIDAKSTHTAAHCQRVPEITKLLAKAACEDETVLADFQMSEDDWHELHLAAWLHDCGKLATPDFILNKPTKLFCEVDGVEVIRSRAEQYRQALQIELLMARSQTAWQAGLAVMRYVNALQTLEEALTFIAHSNQGGEFMRAADQERIKSFALIKWQDSQGCEQSLLTLKEVELLCIAKGTLSREERLKINEHIDVTLEMLESLPFPDHLKRVAEIAGGHHEKIDGTGFPKGLTGDEMSVQAKIMAIADVFEALTSHERPYKKPMKISKALQVLQQMCDNRHLDQDLFQVFLDKEVWRTYALRHLKPEQLDIESTPEPSSN